MNDNHKDTFFSRAEADADLGAQGRFKKETATRVTGVPTYPKQPSHSPWANDPVPPEEPLGLDIEFVGDLGGASSPALPCAETAATPEGGGLSSAPLDDPPPLFSNALMSVFRRRI